MRTLIVAALLALCAGQVSAQDCRAAFGGTYTYAHTGIKPSGVYFSAIARFGFNSDGTFTVAATINGRGAPPFAVTTESHWWWENDCVIAIDRPGFLGIVSDDGRFISLATFDDEQMSGVAVRDNP